jgi:hypothetical protein
VHAHPAPAIVSAWILALGFDMFLHGGLLARFYAAPSPFLLDPVTAFRRIPIGYASFLVLTIALYWLMRQLRVRGGWAGARFGAAAGAVVWGALTAGLYSISTASTTLLAGWWVGQTVELALAGGLLGAFFAGASAKRLWTVTLVVVVACVAATVVLQSIGWASAMKVVDRRCMTGFAA